MSAYPTMSGALDASGTQTGFIPTTEDLRRPWMARPFSNYPEKAEHMEGFETWLNGVKETAAAAIRDYLTTITGQTYTIWYEAEQETTP